MLYCFATQKLYFILCECVMSVHITSHHFTSLKCFFSRRKGSKRQKLNTCISNLLGFLATSLSDGVGKDRVGVGGGVKLELELVYVREEEGGPIKAQNIYLLSASFNQNKYSTCLKKREKLTHLAQIFK